MEKVYQTWERITGKSWSEAQKGGFTTGTSESNLDLQKKLNSGWNPYTSSTLDKTLPNVNDESGETNTNLPAGKGGSLTAFSTVMKAVMNKAASKAKEKGLGVMDDRMAGLRMPGSSLASIMDVVESQATTGFKDIYTSTMDFFSESQQRADDQLKLLISNNALPNLNENQLFTLANMSGMDVNNLLAMQKAQQSEQAYTGLLSVAEAKSLGVPYGTTKQQAVAMGITSSNAGDELSLSNTQLLKMAEKGLPQLIAQDIAGYSGAGYSFDRIYEMMSTQFGAEQAGKYIDTYRDIVTSVTGFELVVPDLKIRESYEDKAKEEAKTTNTKETGQTLEAPSSAFKWFFNPSLWF